MNNELSIRYWIYNVMVNSGRNQIEFAKAIGVTASAVSQWLRGVSRPSEEHLNRIKMMDK